MNTFLRKLASAAKILTSNENAQHTKEKHMIEGLHIEIPSSELKAHIQERADHHKKRAKFYTQQAEDLQRGHQREMEDQHGGSYDPLDGLLRKVNEHQHKAAFFQFIADHIVPNEKYRLSENDLSRVELFSRYF